MTYKTQKLVLGVAILLLVDVLWVSTDKLTQVRTILFVSDCCLASLTFPSLRSVLQFAHGNEEYAKPFFCTYFKTAMFTFYLLIMAIIAPWKDTCDYYQHSANNYSVQKLFQTQLELNVNGGNQ